MVNVRTQNKESRNCTVNVLPMGAGAVDLFAKAGHHCCHCWSEKKARFQSFQPETTSWLPIKNVKLRHRVTPDCLFNSDRSNPFFRYQEQWAGWLPTALVEVRHDLREHRQCVVVPPKPAQALEESISKKRDVLLAIKLMKLLVMPLIKLKWADVFALMLVYMLADNYCSIEWKLQAQKMSLTKWLATAVCLGNHSEGSHWTGIQISD